MATIKGTQAGDDLTGDDFVVFNKIFGLGGNDTLTGGVEADNRIYGGFGNDTLYGAGVHDYLYGNDGNDRLIAFESDDPHLFGGAGRDELLANDQGTYLDGGAGADMMRGGSGADTFVVDHRGDVVDARIGDGAGDAVRASIDFTLAGMIETLVLTGSADLDGAGNAAANTLSGNAGGNRLMGLAGDDAINGGKGDDVILGGKGQDRLVGDEGADRFVFESALDSPSSDAGLDTVVFSHAQGDLIDLRAIDAEEGANGDQRFHWIEKGDLDAAFTGAVGELRFDEGILSGDVDGDGRADFAIMIAGTLKLGDVLL